LARYLLQQSTEVSCQAWGCGVQSIMDSLTDLALGIVRRGIVSSICMSRNVVLSLCCSFYSAALHAQIARNHTDFEKIHKALTSTEKLRYHRPFVFVGEITALGPVFQGPCKEAVDESVDFAISRLLFGKFSGTALHTGYINCTTRPLPSPPFTLHALVIVYCEQQPALYCLNPVQFTEKLQTTVEGWIAAIPTELRN